MRVISILLMASMLVSVPAVADVWKWVDANGKTHYVDSDKAIYTWRDDTGRVFYSDKKDHETAVLVQLVWHSSGSLSDVQQTDDGDFSLDTFAAESEQERMVREAEMAHHCKRAREIYDSYLNAPKLYMTNDAGEKQFLSEAEAERTIAETKVKVDELCG